MPNMLYNFTYVSTVNSFCKLHRKKGKERENLYWLIYAVLVVLIWGWTIWCPTQISQHGASCLFVIDISMKCSSLTCKILHFPRKKHAWRTKRNAICQKQIDNTNKEQTADSLKEKELTLESNPWLKSLQYLSSRGEITRIKSYLYSLKLLLKLVEQTQIYAYSWW